VKTIINSFKRIHGFKALMAFTICLSFLIFSSCQKDEFNQDSTLGLEVLSSSALSKTSKISYGKVKDVEGNVYKTVRIGKQWWMAENLAYLPTVSPPAEGADPKSPTAPYYYVYGYYGTDVAEAKATDNYKMFGVLYNWPAAMTACPSGWHLPSDAEWTTLETYLTMNGYGYEGSGNDIAKSLASKSGWVESPNAGQVGNDQTSNNSSGFTGLPCGSRYWDYPGYWGDFRLKGGNGYYWSSTNGEVGSNSDAWGRVLESYSQNLTHWRLGGVSGNGVRCVKD
jgi:uncharacterized protein (TIGR02145 family)